MVAHHPQGSYAGAMGMGQFMPSSYRHYAVGFDDDGSGICSPTRQMPSAAWPTTSALHHWRWGVGWSEPALIGLAPVGTLLAPEAS